MQASEGLCLFLHHISALCGYLCMKRATIFVLAFVASLSYSCRQSKTDSEKAPAVSVAPETVAEISGPQVLLIYPGSKQADSLKRIIGAEAFYRLSDQNGSHFNELRNNLAGTGITTNISECTRFRFIADDGAITITDLSRSDSPWQVLIFTGKGTPTLASPENAFQQACFLFDLPEKDISHTTSKDFKKPVKTNIPAYNPSDAREDTLPTPTAPLFTETNLRLILPPGVKPPSNRNETSGFRVVTSYISPEQRFGLIFENDIFSNTDRYYTNGVKLDYTAPGLINQPVNRLMLPPGHNSIVHASLSLHHAMFTPFTTKNPPLLDGDRPYASTLFLRYSQTSECAEEGIILTSAIEAGVIGDAALGRYFQKSVHATVPTNDEPLGWETQIRNDLVLSYAAGISKIMLQNRNTEVSAAGSAKAGTLHTYAAMGVEARAGVFTSMKTKLPVSNAELSKKTEKWQYGISGGLEFRLIGYDASLQGGVFNRNNIYTLRSKDIERLVAAMHLGIFARYRKLGIQVSQNYLSREIREGRHHFWGQIGLDYTW